MSQAKVDNYKKEKANRKETMQKEKRQSMIAKTIATVVCVVVIGWIGYSVYGMATAPDTSAAEVNIDAYTNYLQEAAEN